MRRLREIKGITLVALVITIIILIIIAGISINLLTDKNGILHKAQEARKIQLKESAQEYLKMQIVNIKIDKQGNITLIDLLQEFGKEEREDIDVIEISMQTASISCERPDGTPNEITVVVTKYNEFSFTIGSNLELTKICGIEKDKWNGETISNIANSNKAKKVNLTFDANYENGSTNTIKIEKDIECDLPKNQFTREKHLFSKWNTKSDGTGTDYYDEGKITIDEDITLYAIWTQNYVNISFNPNNGSGNMDDIEVEKNKESDLPSNLFERQNYIFESWNTKKDGTGTRYIDKINVNEDTVLYAIWEKVADIAEDLKNILTTSGKKLSIDDMMTTEFFTKISSSKATVKYILDTQETRNKIIANSNAKNLLDALCTAKVPNLTSNTNVIYGSQYSGDYAGYKAFNSSGYWCTQNGKQTNTFIGYNFTSNNKINVKIACIYNGGSGSDTSCLAKKVKLQCSNNNSTWTDASDEITLDNSNKNNYIINTKVDEAYQYWRIYIISSYHSSYVASTTVQFYGIYGKTEKSNYQEAEYLDKNINNIIINYGGKLIFDDVITTNFMSKISSSKTVVKYLLDTQTYRNKILSKTNANNLLNSLCTAKVPNLTNNTNVLYGSQYSADYAGYKAFNSSSGYWCTERTKQQSWIGYNFTSNNKVNVRIARIYNGAVNSGYANNYRVKTVKLQCSNNNSTWTDASNEITLENTGKDNYILNTKVDQAYQYWRIYIKDSYDNQYSASEYVQFYGI